MIYATGEPAENITSTGATPDAMISTESAEPPAVVGDGSMLGTATLARQWAPTVLATIAVIAALDLAQSFFIPMLLGILLTYTLNPFVVKLEHIGVPRSVATGLVMVGVVVLLGLGTYSLRGQVQTIADQLPPAISKLSAGLTDLRRGQAANLRKMESATRELEKAASSGAQGSRSSAPTYVVVKTPGLTSSDFLWTSSREIAKTVGQIITVLFLTLFLLLSGDIFKRKLVRLTGPTLSRRKITVRTIDEVNASIQSYLLMLLSTNMLVGVLSWIALSWIGVENAGAWSVAAGLLHLVPYFGSMVVAGAVGMAAYMQFDALSPALLCAGVSLAIATLVGTLITTWLAGRFSRMNTPAVFVALLFWGWLWGVWGMLLSVPIMVIVKAAAEHVAPQGLVAELLRN